MARSRWTLLVPTLCWGLLVLAGPAPSSLGVIVRQPIAWAAGVPVEVAITELAALGAWVCLAWLVGGAALVLAARTSGATGRIAGAIASRVLPGVLRRALEAAMGLSLAAGGVAGTALPVLAQEAPVTTSTGTSSTGTSSTGTSSPGTSSTPTSAGPFDRPATTPVQVDRPVGPAARRPTPASADATRQLGVQARDAVVVAPGDSLWRIAATDLGVGASDADIDRAWRRWYAVNTPVIGSDPHLIRPGQRLSPPT